ncbi:MAG: SusC/RagA family TonB-linked outer membrane protein [Draconibacterium sp.]
MLTTINDDSDAKQQKNVSGKVTDSSGSPLPGVTVVVKGSTHGTVTNGDGGFSLINVPENGIIVFSFVGMKTQEIPVSGKINIDVIMTEDAFGIEEVVAVGYGTIKRTEITGSVATVNTQNIERMANTTLDKRLQGQIAGLSISSISGEPGAGTNIRIRGNNSISASNRPLIVIDGYPIEDEGEAAGWGNNGVNTEMALNPLSFINPSDIKSVEVLKDASATAVYGSRGANGVIVITTKMGESGKTEITLSTEQSVSPIPDYYDMMIGRQYRERINWYNEFISGGEPTYSDSALIASPSTAWLDEISQVAYSQKYDLSLRGGTERSKYYVSASYLDQNGVILNSNYLSGNIRSNLDMKLTDKLSASLSFNYNRSTAQRRAQSSYSIVAGGPVFKALIARPDLKTKDDEGFLQEIDDNGNYFANPLSEAEDLFDLTNNENTLINMKLQYKIIDGLDLVLSGGSNSISSLREQFFPLNTSVGNISNGRGVYNTTHINTYRIEPYLNFRKRFGGHNFNIMSGLTYHNNINKSTLYSTSNFPTYALGTNAMQLGADIFFRNNYKIERTLKSAYYRANYNYRGRYFISLTGRYDGSSVLAEGKKWSFFPAFSAGWTISNEKFMKNLSLLDNLKLRASYGSTGSQSVAPYSTMTLLDKQNPPLNGSEQSGQGLSSTLGNGALMWEETTQTDIGADLGFFDSRISLVMDYYKKITDGLLQNQQLPPSSGFLSTNANLGTIENKGFEFSVQANIVQNKDFQWSTGITFNNNKTIVKDLGSPGAIIEGRELMATFFSEPSNIMQEGQPFGAFKGYVVEGLVQESDFDEDGNPTFATMNGEKALGSWKFADIDSSGVINSSDRVIIGDPNPDFTIGWSNTFTYKRFTLSAMVYGSFGADILNANRAFNNAGYYGLNGRAEWWNNRWTIDNQHNDPQYPSYNPVTNIQVNDQMIEDGSFIRLKSLTLAYDIPKLKNIKGTQVYLTATNLFTITNYSGFDPEINAKGTNNIIQNVDLGAYPLTKTFTLGVKLSF